ncbi:MAG TPA: YitT family protein [Bacillota bacterium]|nr:YitT family protein [Bacillota bacterium]
MTFLEKTKKLRMFLMITVGSLIYASGVGLFLGPNNLAPGGISGISIVINELLPSVPVGTLILVLNIPIMIIAVWKFGLRFLLSTLWCLTLSSVAIDILIKYAAPLTNDLLLASVTGAVLVATGIGIVFRGGATTGGTDIIVKLLRLKMRHINTGVIFLVVDTAVILFSGIVFRQVDIALYAGIAVLIQMTVLNRVLYGSDEARVTYIISSKKDVIAERIMRELDAGITFLNGKGAYSGNPEEVMLCVLRMRALPQVRDIVKSEDKNAFMIVSNATSVFGEGFKSHDENEF